MDGVNLHHVSAGPWGLSRASVDRAVATVHAESARATQCNMVSHLHTDVSTDLGGPRAGPFHGNPGEG